MTHELMNEVRANTLIILGSSREDSNTLKAIRQNSLFSQYDLIDLQKNRINYYSYDSKELQDDDFHAIAAEMLKYEMIVFATPVYWYSMSGQMKVFLDRLTQLTAEYKQMGRALKGKRTYLIACGGSPSLPEGFEIPFKLTSEYFDMEYVMSFYTQAR
jgi:multimeric flavodoxin WrbA